MSGNSAAKRRGRWLRRFILAGFATALLVRELVFLGFALAVAGVGVWRIPALQTLLMVTIMTHGIGRRPALPPNPSLGAEGLAQLATRASMIRSAEELFAVTNVWDVHLRFTSNQWMALGPERVRPVQRIVEPDGTIVLRNPNALRNGLAGVLGIDLPWSACDMVFGDVTFSNVAVRFKGNGTFVSSQQGYKRPFKVNLGKGANGRALGGRRVLNFHNLVADSSFLSDALGYEFFREAGVPAPRTAFSRLRLTLEGAFEGRLLGLYILVENPDEEWAREWFRLDGVALFKPVTNELFKHLGDDWSAYAGVYDPKTRLAEWHHRRVIELAELVTFADHSAFAERVDDFIDLDEFARFLACEVMIANYDGILNTGQNYLLYLDPVGGRFGFVPWDLDHSWGEFPMIGTVDQRARMNVWRPWIGENRFLERMLTVSRVRQRYRQELERLQSGFFVPDKLAHRMDALAEVVRPFVGEESGDRLERFERALGGTKSKPNNDGKTKKPPQPVHSYKKFFSDRARSVAAQLKGDDCGVVLDRNANR